MRASLILLLTIAFMAIVFVLLIGRAFDNYAQQLFCSDGICVQQEQTP